MCTNSFFLIWQRVITQIVKLIGNIVKNHTEDKDFFNKELNECVLILSFLIDKECRYETFIGEIIIYKKARQEWKILKTNPFTLITNFNK